MQINATSKFPKTFFSYQIAATGKSLDNLPSTISTPQNTTPEIPTPELPLLPRYSTSLPATPSYSRGKDRDIEIPESDDETFVTQKGIEQGEHTISTNDVRGTEPTGSGSNNLNSTTRIPDSRQPLSRASNTITSGTEPSNTRDANNTGDASGTEPTGLGPNNLSSTDRIPDSNLPSSSASNVTTSESEPIDNLRKNKKTAVREIEDETDKDNLPRKLREMVKKVVKKIGFKDWSREGVQPVIKRKK